MSLDPLRRTGRPQVSVVRILFGVFVTVSRFSLVSFDQCFRYWMNDPMVIVDGLCWLCRTVDENRKKASIFAILVVSCCRLPFEGERVSLFSALVDWCLVLSLMGGTQCG